MGSSPEYVLLGDIGATNARLALLLKGLLGPIEWFTVAEFARFADAVDAFLEQHCRHVSVAGGAARGCRAGRRGSLRAHQLFLDNRRNRAVCRI
jgi:glucokinase